MAAWHLPSLLPVLPAVLLCLSPPVPPHLYLLRRRLFTRKHHPPSNNGYHQAQGLPARAALPSVRCCVWQATALPQKDGSSAGWRPLYLQPIAAAERTNATVSPNFTRQPREVGPCLNSAALIKRIRFTIVTPRIKNRHRSDRMERRISLQSKVTGCQRWPRTWGKVKVLVHPAAPVPQRKWREKLPLHQYVQNMDFL